MRNGRACGGGFAAAAALAGAALAGAIVACGGAAFVLESDAPARAPDDASLPPGAIARRARAARRGRGGSARRRRTSRRPGRDGRGDLVSDRRRRRAVLDPLGGLLRDGRRDDGLVCLRVAAGVPRGLRGEHDPHRMHGERRVPGRVRVLRRVLRPLRVRALHAGKRVPPRRRRQARLLCFQSLRLRMRDARPGHHAPRLLRLPQALSPAPVANR